MSEKPISPLRRRMIEDMTMRRFAPRRNTTISVQSRSSLPFSAARPIRRLPKTCAHSSCI